MRTFTYTGDAEQAYFDFEGVNHLLTKNEPFSTDDESLANYLAGLPTITESQESKAADPKASETKPSRRSHIAE